MITMIPGDGVGKELSQAVRKVFEAAQVPIDWEHVELSGKDGKPALDKGLESLRRNRIGFKGILATPLNGPHTSMNVAIRQALDMYASVIPVRSLPGYQHARHHNVDFVLIRENTEGEYSGLEHQSYPGVVESLKVTTQAKSERIVKFAFDYALQHGRRRVTCVHKANIM